MVTNKEQLPTVKILVGYHKPAQIIKSDILIPIHLGRALATQASKDGSMSDDDYQWMLDNMIGDDTGKNISHLNRYFCELTAIYWAWKNYDKLENPDYIGLCHYRRLLDFSNSTKCDLANCCDLVYQNIISDKTRDMYEKKHSDIIKQICKSDIIHGCLTKHNNTVYDQFKELETPEFGLKNDTFLDILNIMKQIYPHYSESIKKYLKSKEHYWYNCFIMKKEIFFEYCEFVFSILLPHQKQIDYESLNINGQRTLGYISERLLGFFITHKKSEYKKIDYKPIIFIENTDNPPHILPAFHKDNIPVVLSSDDNYVPYLYVCLHSIIANTSTNNCYDICILENGISTDNKAKIKKLEAKNISIRFISVAVFINKIKTKFPVHHHFSIATYYRFFIPEIFKEYDKVLYLDCDMLILDDVAKLLNTNLEDKYIAAVRDVEMYRACYNDYYYMSNWTKYLKNTLKINNTSGYFQAGVMLFDINKLNAFNFRTKCIDFLSKINPTYVDQCIMNHVLQEHIKYLDYEWNVLWHLPFCVKIEQQLPISVYRKYKKSITNPKIIHYAGEIKPWKKPEAPLADLWWKYARQTPFYEEFLQKLCIQNIQSTKFVDISAIKKKYNIHRLLSHITFGKLQKKQKQKARNYKHLLRDIKK